MVNKMGIRWDTRWEGDGNKMGIRREIRWE